MTPAAADDTEVREYSTAGRELGPADRLPFKLDGEPYVLRRPKLSIAVAMLSLVDDSTPKTIAALGIDLTRLLMSLLAYIEPAPSEPPTVGRGDKLRPNPNAGQLHGQARLRQRLDDPDDRFDLPDLEPIFRDLVGAMFQRPTPARPAPSAKPRATTSRGSGAGTRRKPRATSTT